VIDAGLLAPLPEGQLPMDGIFPTVRLDELQTRDGNIYAVTEKFGGGSKIGLEASERRPRLMRTGLVLENKWDRLPGRA
jgi:hypothetical protein